MAGQIRLDHGAIVALLVPPPSAAIVATLRSILETHNEREEGAGGLYGLIEQLAGKEIEGMLQKLKAMPEVPVLPHNEKPFALEAARRAVTRAGYEFREGEG